MLLSVYGNIDTILKLPYEDAVELVVKARERQRDERLWQMWLTLYPNMNKETWQSFSEFKERSLITVSKKPTKDILKESEEIMKSIGR